MTAQKMSAQEIIAFIGNAEKKTNVKVTFEGELATAVPASVTKLGNVLFGDWKDIEPLLANLTENKDYVVEQEGYEWLGTEYKRKSRKSPRTIQVSSVSGNKIKKQVNEKQGVFWSEKYAKRAKSCADKSRQYCCI